MKKRASFIKYIQTWSLVAIITIGGGAVTLDVIDSTRDFNQRADNMRTDHIEVQKNMIKREVERVVEMIRSEKAQIESQAKERIKTRVHEAYSIAQNIYRENRHSKSEPEIKKMILDALSPIRFGQDEGYYFISRFDGVGVLSPSKPDLEGKDLSDLQDCNQQYLIRDLVDIARESGEGFYRYHWLRPPEEGDNHEKIAFVKKLDLYDWYIGTSLYVEDIENHVNTSLLSTISKVRFGKEGYIFVNRFNGDALISSGRLFSGTRKLWEIFDIDPDQMKNIFNMEYEAALKPDGDYIYYSFLKLSDETRESPKASFIYGIPEMQWLVGAGVYLDDVETDITLMQEELNRQIRVKMIRSFLVTLGVVVLFLILFGRLNRRLKNDFKLFIQFFDRIAHSDEPIDRDQIQFRELDRMAGNANRMLSDRKKAEEALRKSEADLRAVFEAANNVAFIKIDCTGKSPVIIEVSPGAEQIFGYRPEEIIGRPATILYLKDEQEKFPRIMLKMREDKKSYTDESTFVRKSGESFPSLITMHPAFSETGVMTTVLHVSIDITQRKRAEEELRKSENLKSIGTLAGGIAHDFNNIMLGVFGNISLAKEELSSDHPCHKFLLEAESSMSRAIRLTSQLLTFSRGGAPIKESVDLGRLITDVVRFDLSGSNVKPIFELEDDLSSVKVDETQMQQVFSNLTINSKQAMPLGGNLLIRLKNREILENEIPGVEPGRYIEITVKDEGIGIEEKHLDRIFDPYFTSKETGVGLGLTTVYSVITSHGGNVHVDSQLGKGTSFSILLPTSESNMEPEEKQAQTDNSLVIKNARILLMDDEEMIREVVLRMLDIPGFTVKTTSDGTEAIRLYKEAMDADEPFDVVIMDLTIPGGMGGKDAVKDILMIDPEAKVVVSSGYANDPVMSDYAEYGFCDIVAKPYTKNKLLETVTRCLGPSG